MEPLTTARVDSWTWAVRMFKTRSQATAACRAGHVKVNGERAKSAQTVRIGDEVRVRISGFDRILVVSKIMVKRVSAPVAAECFVDQTPPPPPREEVALLPMRDRGAGRPTKRERREIDKLRAPEVLPPGPDDE
ncbi:RNA-binding S4 domain-containing protein [Cryobacterium sp. TMT1-62]|uniref:RNA-binding S4 domain-containing protein n=1 Tax=Cryobacterium sandaracinum TaxID=1259247 RepID=A0ABY2JH63_9MICO|nr:MULTISPECIES: RNA-binding S4 domain-containing protein [Cryobacterium]TFB59509.1 RNA-binding S4 domain-containing protein [Cryobacterium sp. Hz7]TFB60485.1 RNA-binding S4 domain-containing protein [Cryobacterium sp. Sr3]TFC38902.1 RNA-binding S4 domain-containing protein [Cryobacterium sp. TMT2-14]TFC54335.1 RNA-binding S4 domain-containing protein [Cryobacterium sp. TMT2-17-1]TFC70657.1 RNA-binding S4 domain-containing protein [Cryobacterium sp. TMT2-4]